MQKIKENFETLCDRIENNPFVQHVGFVTRIVGMRIEVRGFHLPVGARCRILVNEHKIVHAEVIGFAEDICYLMASHPVIGIKPGTKVISDSHHASISVGPQLLGRVLDAEGDPLDGLGRVLTEKEYPLSPGSINPLNKKIISEPLDVGVRAINAFLTIGKGQRIGIFASSGVGKSVLLGMITHYTKADIIVVGLVGERGREVKEFVDHTLGAVGLARSVVVIAPADTLPLMRVNCALRATVIAEYFRDQGLDVLLIQDSLTRYAQAWREILLSVGEPPATKGYTPSVFAKLSQLVERAGSGELDKGSITAIYTVLMEGEEFSDPIAEHTRSVLDGHIYLSKTLADAGHYPAIDIEKSISRVMPFIVKETHLQGAHYFKQLSSAYSQNKELINLGMYQMGADPFIDESVRLREKMRNFLCQKVTESATLCDSVAQLYALFSEKEKLL